MKALVSKISVVVPTFNSWDTLKPAISSLYKQTQKIYEIIVIDNASSDQTSKNVRKFFPKVKLVILDKNTGVTGGRNAGIDHAHKDSKYILFFDHDMLADKKMLGELLKVAQSNGLYGIITPKIFYYEDKKRIWAAGTNINLWTGQILFRGGKDIGQYNTIDEVQVAPAAMLVKKEVINKVKRFDNRYFATYEDTDFCFRAKDHNFKTIYAPTAIAYHKISPNPSNEQKRLLDRSFWVGRNRILFMRDYGKNYYFFLLFSIMYLLYFIKMSLEQKNLNALINYLKGFISGILQANKL